LNLTKLKKRFKKKHTLKLNLKHIWQKAKRVKLEAEENIVKQDSSPS
jgi:hypothetical protein